MHENRVVPLRQPDEIDDLLTENSVGRNVWLSGRSMRSSPPLWPGMPISSCRRGTSALSGTGMIPCARSRRESIGPIEVSKLKARDRGATTADERIRYSSPKGAADEEPRRSSAGSLSARRLDRRLSGRADGFARQGCAQSFALRDRRLKSEWEDEYRRWQTRDLDGEPFSAPPRRSSPACWRRRRSQRCDGRDS